MEIVEAAGINVALVAGRCAGADFERLLEADLRIAGDGATFSAAGVADPVACAVRLTRLLGEAAAKELLLADRTADAANALRLALVTRVVPGSALGETARDVAERLRALGLTGAGDCGFCGGADLKEEEELTTETVGKFLQRGDETFRALREYERPIVAAVNGWAMGGGLALALWCDVRVGSTRAKLGAVGVKVGLMASNVQLSRLLFEGRARDLLLTGRTLEAEEAHRLGLLSSVVTPEALMDEATAWARDIAARPPHVVAALKRAVNTALDPVTTEARR